MSVPDKAMKLKDGKIIADQLSSMIAVQFVQATANAAGSYVVYNGEVFYLPDGHTAGATWANTTKEGPTNIGEINTQLKNTIQGIDTEITDIKNEVYLTDETEIVDITWDANGDGKYIGANGVIGNTQVFHYSDLISVEQNKNYTYMFSYKDIYTDFTCRIHGYDKDGIWIKQIGYKLNIFAGGSIHFIVDDERIKFIRISIRKEDIENILVKGEPTEINIQWDANGDGKYIAEDGAVGESSSFHYSKLMEVTESKAYYYSFSRTATTVIHIRIHGYDSNGNWIEQIGYSKTNTNEGSAYIPFIVGNGIKYIRISTSKNVTGESLWGYTDTKISIKTVVESLSEKTENIKLKISSMGRIDDSIDSPVESGSEYEMCAVRKKYMGNNKPPVTIGWLYQRSPVSSSGCELWYSANQMDKPKLVGTMTGISPNDEYRTFDISPKYGDIITCKRDSRNAPVVYDASSEASTIVSGLATNPIGWQRNCGGEFALDGSDNEYFMFGEYTGYASTSSGYGYVNVWKVTYPYTDPANWRIVLSLQRESSYNAGETGKVWHVHTVMRDPYTNIWYITTGDCDEATIWYYSTDEGETWTQLITGSDLESQRARLLNFVFTKDYIWWANDYGTNHSVNRVSRDGNGLIDVPSIVRIAELNKMQSTYATAYLDYPKGLLMLDRVDTSFGALTDKLIVQFYSFDDEKVHDLYTFKRMSNSPDLFFGFKCKCYTLRQSPYDARIGVGFDVAAPNWVEMNGNADNSMWTLFFEVS